MPGGSDEGGGVVEGSLGVPLGVPLGPGGTEGSVPSVGAVLGPSLGTGASEGSPGGGVTGSAAAKAAGAIARSLPPSAPPSLPLSVSIMARPRPAGSRAEVFPPLVTRTSTPSEGPTHAGSAPPRSDPDDLDTGTPFTRHVAELARLADANANAGSLVLITDKPIWSGLQRRGMSLQLELPDPDEMYTPIHGFLADHHGVVPIAWTEEDARRAAEFLQGVTEGEAVNLMATLVAKGSVEKDDVLALARSKDRIFSEGPRPLIRRGHLRQRLPHEPYRPRTDRGDPLLGPRPRRPRGPLAHHGGPGHGGPLAPGRLHGRLTYDGSARHRAHTARSSTTVISGGAPTRTGGADAPAPRDTYS
ncbi:hypothetical protein ACWC0A_20130 [Streptomyces scopuliridis]